MRAGSREIPRLWEDEPEPSGTAPTDLARNTMPRRPAVAGAKRAVLLVMTGSAAGRVVLLESRKVTIGRSRQADFTLQDEGVSRMHCVIAVQHGKYVLADLGSTHGTLVNGVRAERVELQPGDRIELGPDALLEFDLCDAAEQGVLDKLYQGATRDLLTHALNQRAFEERLAAEVSYAVRHEKGLVAVAVAIDGFGQLVAAHGSAGCDLVLREVSSVIASTLRREDVLARTKTNGFVILARGLTLAKGMSLAERMRKLMEERAFSFESASVSLTICAGVGELGDTGASPSGQALLELAEARLAAAQLAGPNRVSRER
jgi:diguanylate cyclase (GGDEF)-like protein